jgi:hypothetical protein
MTWKSFLLVYESIVVMLATEFRLKVLLQSEVCLSLLYVINFCKYNHSWK